jgi:hypothetical protein
MVDVTNQEGEHIIVTDKKPLNLNTFSFIALEEFLINFKDKTWENLNQRIDKDLLNKLKKQLHDDLDKLANYKNIDI